MADVIGFNPTDARDLMALVNPGDSVQRLNFGSGGGASLFRFETTAAYTTGTTVASTIKTMGGSTVGTSITLSDPEAIFLGLPSGSKGLCILQDGTYYAIQALCAAEEGVP